MNSLCLRQVLHRLPREYLLILKTNDLLRHIEGKLTGPTESASSSSAADALAEEMQTHEEWDAVAWKGSSTEEAAEARLGHRELTLVHLSACCVRAVRTRKLHKCARAGWLTRLQCGLRVHWRFDWLLVALLVYRLYLEMSQRLVAFSQLRLRATN